jgi:hypothetical protein
MDVKVVWPLQGFWQHTTEEELRIQERGNAVDIESCMMRSFTVPTHYHMQYIGGKEKKHGK